MRLVLHERGPDLFRLPPSPRDRGHFFTMDRGHSGSTNCFNLGLPFALRKLALLHAEPKSGRSVSVTGAKGIYLSRPR